jgi:hypothetical protein
MIAVLEQAALPIAGIVSAIIAVLAALIAVRRRGVEHGTTQEQARNARKTLERIEQGRQSLARHRGDDPAERLRRNEGRWQ